jgi:hypothetical protein
MTLSNTSVRHVADLFAARGVIAREHLGTLNIGPRGVSCFYGATARGEVSAVQSNTRLLCSTSLSPYHLLMFLRPVSSQE